MSASPYSKVFWSTEILPLFSEAICFMLSVKIAIYIPKLCAFSLTINLIVR